MKEEGMPTAVVRRDIGDEWLDIEGASRYTKLSRHTVYDAVRTGGLRHVRVGGRLRLRFKRTWLDQWLEQFSLQNDAR
jgi:excisionase family DNA binding protein